jgi:hypothetical protein
VTAVNEPGVWRNDDTVAHVNRDVRTRVDAYELGPGLLEDTAGVRATDRLILLLEVDRLAGLLREVERRSVEDRLQGVADDLAKTSSPELQAAGRVVEAALMMIRIWSVTAL